MLKIEKFEGKFNVVAVKPSEQAEGVALPKPERRMTDSDRFRPDASFKIKDSFQKINQTQPVVQSQPAEQKQTKPEARELVDEEKVIAALEKYIQQYSPEPTVSIALKTHRPKVEGEKIILAVDNQLQMDKLEALRAHLQGALMKSLKNGYIILSFQIFDCQTTGEEKKLYTASEKFEHFVQLNPVVTDLKTMFGLELE